MLATSFLIVGQGFQYFSSFFTDHQVEEDLLPNRTKSLYNQIMVYF